jgi:RNA polymerase primary sigma factor
MSVHQEVVEDPRAQAPDDELLHSDMLGKLGELLAEMDEREATILRLRYGLDAGTEPLTLKEIGKLVGLTRERVRQIERDVLRRLQRIIDGDSQDIAA